MNNYEEFLKNLDRAAYHEGETSWEEDGFTVYRTHPWSPPGCHDSCGCLMYMKDGLLDHVEGDPLSSYSNGKLCMRCLDMAEATNHPDRIMYPMKRAREYRGDNTKWERISWEEALDTVAGKIKEYSEKYGEQSINVVRGTGRDIDWGGGLLSYLGIQTPIFNMQFMTGFACYSPRCVPSNCNFGDYWIVDASMTHEDRYLNSEWKVPGVVMIWGNEPLKSNADGYLGHWLVECMQMGTKIISIDPRLTWWGARADYFLQLRSGTDVALGMAMINYIVSEGLYDSDFVEKWTYGFEELVQACAEMTPERAAEICDLDVEDIRGAARMFATEGPGSIQWGLSLCQQDGCLSCTLICLDLIAICGYVDVPGGAVLVRDAYGFPHHVSEGYLSPEKKALTRAEVGPGAVWGDTRQSMYDWENHDPRRIRMSIYESSNPLANACPDGPRIYDSLKNSEYVVGMDPFLTPTLSAFADILLPMSMAIERNTFRSWWTPVRANVKITEYGECKSDEDIAIELINRLNPGVLDDYIKEGKDIMNWRLKGDDTFARNASLNRKSVEAEAKEGEEQKETKKVFNRRQNMAVASPDEWDHSITFDQLVEMSPVYDNFCSTYYKYEKGLLRSDGQPGFNTVTGRIELYSLTYQAWGVPPLPEYIEPMHGPIGNPEEFEKYPLICNNGVRSYEFFHSEHRQLETMREFHPWPLVCMNQNVADRFGIEDGEWTWIESPIGRFMQKACIVPTMKDYCISVEAGWWYPEDDSNEPTLYRTFDSNANNMLSFDEVSPYGVGNTHKTSVCTIYPVRPGDTTPTEQVLKKGGFPLQQKRREACRTMWKEQGIENN